MVITLSFWGQRGSPLYSVSVHSSRLLVEACSAHRGTEQLEVAVRLSSARGPKISKLPLPAAQEGGRKRCHPQVGRSALLKYVQM